MINMMTNFIIIHDFGAGKLGRLYLMFDNIQGAGLTGATAQNCTHLINPNQMVIFKRKCRNETVRTVRNIQ